MGKYRGLIAAITAFLLIVAGVASVNWWIAQDLDQDAISVNLSGRQRMLSQRIAKTIFQTNDAIVAQEDATASMTELAGAVKLFDTTLRGFDLGGEVTGGAGQSLQLRQAAVGRSQIDEAKAIWQSYLQLLTPLVDAKGNLRGGRVAASAIELNALVAYAKANNVKILTLMNELTTALETQATNRAALLRKIQIGALSAALMLFGYIVFFALRNLRNADAAVLAAKQETDNILNTVSDGLFLIDRDLKIGQQQSKSLAQLFANEQLAGKSLPEVLGKMVPSKTLETAKTFLDLLFGDRVKESLMGEVNPLKEVEINVPGAANQMETKHLAFRFRRVLQNEKLTHLLVSAADVSSEVELRRELELTRKRSEEQVNLLTQMMHAEPAELSSFMDKTQKSLDAMNEVLSTSGIGQTENVSKLAQLYRIAHTVKGDAAALSFDPIEAWAHRFEDLINGVRKQGQISGTELLPLTVALREMYQQIAGIRELTQKLSQVRNTIDGAGRNAGGKPRLSVWTQAQLLVPKVAERTGKLVKLDIKKDPGVHIAQSQFDSLSDALVQLVRNAIVHGIEKPEQRRAAGKTAEGHIRIHLAHGAPGMIEVNVEDDGAGLDFERIRQHAIDAGHLAKDQAENASLPELAKLLFAPGFSTADRLSEDAGRGVGLDVLEKSVQQLGGRISLGSKAGRGARFSMVLPAVEQDLAA